MRATATYKKGITARIYPTMEQAQYINKLLGCCRFTYNNILELSTRLYKDSQMSLSPAKRMSSIVGLKESNQFLKESHSKVLQQSVRDLNRAFENFFKKRADYPQFKSRKDNNQSCRFPSDAFIGIKGNRLSLIKTLQDILFKCSRRDERYLNRNQDKIKNVTIRKTCDGRYYVSFCVGYQPVRKENNGSVIGLDLGIKDFLIDSNGNRVSNPHFHAREERKLKHLKRQHSKKQLTPTGEKMLNKKGKIVDVKKPSNNREKLRKRIAKLEAKITNRRKTFQQQLSSRLVDENQVICIEDLNIKGLEHNHKLAKHIQDCGWGGFVNMLEYKCAAAGRTLVKVDRFYPSSKRCHGCGYINKELKLSDREWACPQCGAVIDRDYNAALNIRDRGLEILGLSSPEVKPEENPPVDDKGPQAVPLKSCGSSIQEKNEFH